jgi:hypothetical protein
MEGWQSKAAFVIHFREDTDIPAGRLEGRIEHIASYRAKRFNSVEELLAFTSSVLAELKSGNHSETAAEGS